MSERASQTAQRYVDAMNIASAKIEQLQAEVEALRGQNAALIGMVERDTAAIQRVRGELDWINDHPLGVDADEDNAVYSTVSRILRALDGDA